MANIPRGGSIMTAKRANRKQTPRQNPAPPASDENAKQRRDSGEPGGGQGRVDVTGIVPENVHVDPNITEGHPGYQESGDSEIIPGDRLAAGEADKG
jgi:hypothetical protein